MNFRVERGHLIPTTTTKVGKSIELEKDFKKVLDETKNTRSTIKISNHAEERMIQRGISLHEQDMKLISQGMDKLKEKGARESLVLYKDMAFIASINNKTIITVMGNKEMEIVTNIDSAMLIK